MKNLFIVTALLVVAATHVALAGTIASKPQRCMVVSSVTVTDTLGAAPSFKFHNRCLNPVSFYYAFPAVPSTWFTAPALAPGADYTAPPLFPAALDAGLPSDVGVKECPVAYHASGTNSDICVSN